MRKHNFLFVFLLLASYFLLLGGCKKNQTPEIPKVPAGLTDTNNDNYDNGYTDTSYIFYTDTRDAEDEDVSFKFDWGDGNESDWSEYITSGETFYISHSYPMADTYKIKTKTKDIHNNESDWSADYEIIVISKSASPFNPSIISLADSIALEDSVFFKVCATDTSSTNDSLKYQCQRGNTLDTTWRPNAFMPSGDTATVGHAYLDTSELGIQEVRVRAKDQHGSVSEWSAPCTVIAILPLPPEPPSKPKLKETYSTYYRQTPFTFSTTGGMELEFRFIWGDGKTSPPMIGSSFHEIEHSFVKIGICSVRATVEDKFGQSDTSLPYEIDIQSNLLKEWGSDILDAPFGITISEDTLYVVDHNNHEIKRFTLDGTLVDEIGTNVLESPMYVATDSGFVYVTDAHNFICKFRKTGELEAKWGQGKGSGDGEFDLPTGIAVDSNYVYVVDSRNLRIQKFDKVWGPLSSNKNSYSQWSIPSKSRGMTITGDTLYVSCNFDNSIKVYGTTGNSLGPIGKGEGVRDGYLVDPCDIAVYGDYVFVADTDNNRIQKFTKSNNFVIRWGCMGSYPCQFNKPQGIAIDNDGNIYVVDTVNNRIQKFEPGSKGGAL